VSLAGYSPVHSTTVSKSMAIAEDKRTRAIYTFHRRDVEAVTELRHPKK
jgi:general stress protein 26